MRIEKQDLRKWPPEKGKRGRIMGQDSSDEILRKGETVEDFLHAEVVKYKNRYFVFDMAYFGIEKETENKEEALDYAKSLENSGRTEYNLRF